MHTFKKIILIYAYFICLLYSCINRDEDSKKMNSKFKDQIEVYPLQGFDESLDKPLFAVTKVIKLNNLNKNYFISHISKLIVQDSFLIISDRKLENAFVFDINGNPRSKLGKLGSDINEYRSLDNIFVNYESKLIYLLSNKNRSIFAFDVNGKFQYRIVNKELFPYEGYMTASGEYLFYNNYNLSKYPYNLVLKNNNFKTVDKLFRFDNQKQNMGISFAGGLIQDNQIVAKNQFYFNEAFKNVIYKLIVRENAIESTPLYKFNFGATEVPVSICEDFSKVSSRMIDYSFLNNEMVDLNNYLLFSFQYNKRRNVGVYHKLKQKCFSFYRTKSTNDCLEWFIDGLFTKWSNDEVIAIIEPEVVFFIRSEYPEIYNNVRTRYPQLYIEFEKMDLGDNPVLLILKLDW